MCPRNPPADWAALAAGKRGVLSLRAAARNDKTPFKETALAVRFARRTTHQENDKILLKGFC